MPTKQEASVVSDVSQSKQTASSLVSELNMEKSLQQESFFISGGFLTTASPTSAQCNEDGILEDGMPCVSGVLAYVFERRFSVSGADGDGEPQERHQDFSYVW